MNEQIKYTGCQDEHKTLMKIINYRFPNKYKQIGLITGIMIFGFLLVNKFIGSNSLIVKELARTVMLLFLLLASLSRDKIEDEYSNHLRAQSYALAFICAISYAIGIPLITYLLDILINEVTSGDGPRFMEVSSFEVMFMLICFQLLFFEMLKRLAGAK